MATSRDLGDYLRSLAMKMRATPFDPQGRKRIAQLIGKSNQFNLTTRRHSEDDVARFEADPTTYTLQIRLEDKFGDLGMIAVVICQEIRDGENLNWNIDTWLMSCRVLGRKVEEAMLREIVGAAKAKGVKQLIGTYIPTAKNAMVADHYSKLGFVPADKAEDGCTYVLDLAGYAAPTLPMEVLGLELA
jgi:FkbH-like protein